MALLWDKNYAEETVVVKRIKLISAILFLVLCMLLLKSVFTGNISTIEEFRQLMMGYGIWGPAVLTLIQAFQVVVPVLPGYLGCAVGAISYGTVMGFMCNYIGICAGSIIAFLIAKKFGKKVVIEMFSKELYEKWSDRIGNKRSYNVFLFIATLLPLFPDDFLCYFSGLIHMDRKKFIWIILLGKPWCILAYSVAFGLIGCGGLNA